MAKPDVLIVTPGRFVHLCLEMSLKLEDIQYVVLDEADRLFEMGFGEQLTEILRRLPDHRQTALFSATLPKLLVDFAKAGLNDPTLIRLNVDDKIPETLKLGFFHCPRRGKERGVNSPTKRNYSARRTNHRVRRYATSRRIFARFMRFSRNFQHVYLFAIGRLGPKDKTPLNSSLKSVRCC